MTDWWHTTQWRLIQTNMREIDMRDIDAAQVVADLQAFKANVVMVNAAGIIASYPTKLPFHFQSQYLTGDSLLDVIEACHAADIRVIARTDYSKVRRPIYEQHPDWAYRTIDGDIVDYNGDVHVCINGPYQQHYALKIMEELFETHPFDGIFFNMGGYQTRDYSGNDYGICHCPHCTRRFDEMYGLALPAVEDMGDPVFRTYTEFKRRTLAAHHEKVYKFISERWPHICIANHTDFGRGFIRQESNTAIGRPLPHWQYSASDNTKWAVGSFPQMVSSNTTVDFIDFPYRHVAVNPAQQGLRLAQNLANGGALDYYLIGRLDNHEDRSGYDAVKDVFHFHAANEATYIGTRSEADVLLLKAGEHVNEYRGWFRILAENHYLFDVIRLDLVASASAALDRPWEQYKAVVVPEITAMSDALAKKLDKFAADGGTVIAVGQSGFRDENGNLREEPALQCLGIEKVLTVREDMRSSYFKMVGRDVACNVSTPDDVKSKYKRFANTELVYMNSPYIYAKYADAADQYLKLIPPHNFGPPERCYYDQVTAHPGVVVNPFGKGRAIYVPWSPGALFHRQGYVNTAWFCDDLLAGFAGLSPVGGNASPQVEITLFSKIAGDGGYYLLHLVNGSGHFGVTFYDPVPMTDVEVVVPVAKEPASVKGLRSGVDFAFDWRAGQLTVRVPKLELFEAIKIEV